MNIYALLPLLAVVINLGLGVFVLIRGWEYRLNRIFGVFALTMSLWALSDAVVFSTHDPTVALQWGRAGNVLGMLFASLMLHFFLVLTDSQLIKKGRRWLIYLGTPLLGYWSLFSDKVYSRVEPAFFGMNKISGPLYWLTTLNIMGLVGISLYLGIKKYKKSKDKRVKLELSWIILGLMVPFLGGIITQVVLPWYGIVMMPSATTLSTIAMLVFAYVILRYKMLLQVGLGNIRRKLRLGIVLASIIPMVLISFISFKVVKDILIRSVFKDLESDVKVEVVMLEASLLKPKHELMMLSGNLLVQKLGSFNDLNKDVRRGLKQELIDWFLNLAKVNQDYLEISYLDKNGSEVVKIKRDSKEGLVAVGDGFLKNRSEQVYFKEAIKNKKSEIYIAPLSLSPERYLTTIYAIPVINRENQTKNGVLMVKVLMKDLKSNLLNENKEVYISQKEFFIDSEGDYLVNLEELSSWNKDRAIDTKASFRDDYGYQVWNEISNHLRGTIELKSRNQILSYRRVYPDRTDLENYYLIVALVNRDEVLTPIKNLQSKISLIVLVIGLVVVGLASLLARSIAIPLQKLTELALALQKGNMLARVRIQTNDEMGVLGRALNKMADFVLEMQANLEKKIEDRTKELEEKKASLEVNQKAILNILEDVDEEKKRSVRLAEEMKKFRTAAEASSEMMVFTDAEGVVLWGNKAVEEITGFALKDVLSRKVGVLWGKLMSKKWYAHLWKAVKQDKVVFEGEITNHRKDGEKFLSWLTIYPLLDSRGEVQFLVATQRDITKEKAVDQMKTDFISLASHQLRTPLSAMKWFLEMLLDGDMGKLNKEQLEAITNIDQSNERMIELVNALLNVSRIESGRIIVEPEKVELGKLVKSVIGELEEKIKNKEQKIVVKIDKKVPIMMLDPKLLRQVIMNLLTNANKYSPKKGKIEVKVEYDNKTKEVVVQVKDNGMGIPEKDQKRLFERFFRASNVVKEETDGTGLGLYLAKIIVESSGGKLWFESKEGKGTSFWFSLPKKGMKAKKGEVRLS